MFVFTTQSFVITSKTSFLRVLIQSLFLTGIRRVPRPWYFEPLHLEQSTICTWHYKIKNVCQAKTATTLQVSFPDPCLNDLFIFIALPKKLEQALDWYPKPRLVLLKQPDTHSLCLENIRFYEHALTRYECTSLLRIQFPSWFHNTASPAMEVVIPFYLRSCNHLLFLRDFCKISVTELLCLLKEDASFDIDPIIQLFEEVFLSI